MRSNSVRLSVALIAIAIAAAAAQPAPPASPPQAAVTADTPEHAPSGATFTAPKAWTIKPAETFVTVQPPESDTRVAIVAIPAAQDGKAAAAQAWSLYRPDAHRPFKLMIRRAPRDGWDERQVVEYETSPNEKAVVETLAFRNGSKWTVVILDGTQATVEKRAAAVGLIIQSLRPAAYHRENFAGRTAHPLDAARIATLRSFVQTSIQQLGVPGAAMALIDHGKVVYEGGEGVRRLGSADSVDANTLFMVASNTKGMSTLLLAELADQGKLAWDQPVTQVYPAFRLGDADTTQHVLMKNLVCACTGLPRKDYDWIFDTGRATPASTTFTQLAATQPTSKFGEVFQYNNLMASAAGYIGGHLVFPHQELGAAYDGAMQKMVFGPLGMHDTTFDMRRALAADHASPHGDDVDGHPAVANMDFNYVMLPYRPAGGAWSSAHDMAKYVQDELSLGLLPDGERLVSAKNLLIRRAPGVPTGEDGYYGMGIEGDTTWGVTVIHHGGSMAGYKTDWMALPDAGVGAVILTNSDDGQMLLRPFMRRLLEVLYDGKPQAAADVAAAAAANQAEIAKARERLVVPAAPALVAGLAAAYTSPELGHLAVRKAGGNVVFDFGAWKSQVASRKNDDGTVSFFTIDPTNDGFEFVVGRRDSKPALTLRDGQHEYVYTAAS